MSAHQRSTLSACLRLPRAVAVGAAMLLGTAGALVPAPAMASTGLVVTDLNNGVTKDDLANALVGSGVTVSNVTYTGAPRAAGEFSGGATIVGFPSGIILDSGKVQTYPSDPACSRGVEGPNTCHELGGPAGISNSTDFGLPGDPQLTTLSGFSTFDASILNFDFVPQFSSVQFQYVFSSEEYSDYSNTSFNDVFAFFINGTNCALTPDGKPVSVNTINNGSDVGGDPTPHNAALFRSNVPPTIDTQMDGLTTVLTCSATVNAGVTNHMKLAIADASDGIFDSAVFLKGGSLISGTQVATSLSGGGQTGAAITVPSGTMVTDSATLTGANASTASGTVTYTVYAAADCSINGVSAGTKTVVNGVVPNSDPVGLNGPTGTVFHWTATYSGDGLNNGSSTPCALETVTLTNPEQPIAATGSNVSATEGALFAGTVATFTDPTTTATAAEYTASISWGDGHTSAGIVTGPTGGTFTVTGSNTYIEEGTTYAVTVTITDIDNTANGATTTSTATVSDAALTASCAVVATSSQSFSGLTATFTDAASPSGTRSDFTATINWGDGNTSAGTVAGSDGGPYSVSGSHPYTSTGPFTITTTINDVGGSSTSTGPCPGLIVFGFAPGGGSFVIGDNNSATGTKVTFWGAQWWKLNSLSGGSAPASFKGFAEAPATPACGVGWSSDTGNSTPPPAGPLPAFMGVLVTRSASQSGSTDSGNTVHIVVVQTNPGYQPNPGHPGTATVVAQVC